MAERKEDEEKKKREDEMQKEKDLEEMKRGGVNTYKNILRATY